MSETLEESVTSLSTTVVLELFTLMLVAGSSRSPWGCTRDETIRQHEVGVGFNRTWRDSSCLS